MLYIVDSKTGNFLIHVFGLGFRTFSVAGDGERMQVAVGMDPETFRRALVRAKCLEKELGNASGQQTLEDIPCWDGDALALEDGPCGDDGALTVEDDPEQVTVIAKEETADPRLLSSLVDGKGQYEVLDIAAPHFDCADPSGMPEAPVFRPERIHKYMVSSALAPAVEKVAIRNLYNCRIEYGFILVDADAQTFQKIATRAICERMGQEKHMPGLYIARKEVENGYMRCLLGACPSGGFLVVDAVPDMLFREYPAG